MPWERGQGGFFMLLPNKERNEGRMTQITPGQNEGIYSSDGHLVNAPYCRRGPDSDKQGHIWPMTKGYSDTE